jgi:hypothetical protein
MKLALHFDAQLSSIPGNYAHHYEHAIANALLSWRSGSVSSRVFIGDLLMSELGRDEEHQGNRTILTFNPERFNAAVNAWLEAGRDGWNRLSAGLTTTYPRSEIFVVCFESIESSISAALHASLADLPGYLGAMQINDESPVHWVLYSHGLIPRYRIMGDCLYLYHQGHDPESKDEAFADLVRGWGFRSVNYEDLNGKYSIFDEYHDFEHARRVAEWKRRGGALLAFIADEIVSRLADSAPKLGDKIWSALRALQNAETDEDFAHVAMSCRRIFEYVVDAIFPPTDEKRGDRKLGGQQYRNRLLAFADDQHRSDTNIELISVATETLAKQVETLSHLANKGVHAEVMRAEARRCLLRTIVLLDDIVSLRREPFQVKDHLDPSGFADFLRRSMADENRDPTLD